MNVGFKNQPVVIQFKPRWSFSPNNYASIYPTPTTSVIAWGLNMGFPFMSNLSLFSSVINFFN